MTGSLGEDQAEKAGSPNSFPAIVHKSLTRDFSALLVIKALRFTAVKTT